MDRKIIVAIDGHSSCGKSTMAKVLAQEIGYIYVDTGAMYRGVTLVALRAGLINGQDVDVEALTKLLPTINLHFELNEERLPELYVDDELIESDIRTMQVSNHVSLIAALPVVRNYLSDLQRRMGDKRGVVMDGRDIGTTVFPDAELKIFITADPKIRAERRLAELRSKGDDKVTLEEVLQNVQERDYMDTHRVESPLRKAEDAIVIDNSNLSKNEQNEKLKQLFLQTLKKLN